jgi:hypothetical protein
MSALCITRRRHSGSGIGLENPRVSADAALLNTAVSYVATRTAVSMMYKKNFLAKQSLNEYPLGQFHNRLSCSQSGNIVLRFHP